MARVTVEDCEKQVENRFDLVLMAGHRARQISSGSPALVEQNNDKNTVIALREIAEEKIAPTAMSEALIQSYQKTQDVETPEEVATETSGVEISDAMEEMLVDGVDSVVGGIEIKDTDSQLSQSNMFEDVAEEDLTD